MSEPVWSVVIPSYNRCATLRRVLDAFGRQEPPELAFEVLVVDDGSTDGTLEMLAAYQPARYDFRFERQENSGPAAARNRGIALARGEMVLITGDDIEPAPRLLAEHSWGHEQRPEVGTIVLGLTRWPPGAELTTTMRHVDGVGAQQFSYHYFEDGAEYDFRHFYTSNVSLRRQLLEREPEGFSTDFKAAAFEDAELAYRLSRHGGRIFYRQAALAFHHHHYTAAAFYARQRRCGEMAAVLYAKHPQLEKWLSVLELQETRLAALAAAPPRRRKIARLAAEVDAWERRAVALAAFFDSADVPPVDGLFFSLFRYAYLAGLADAREEEATARRLRSTLFLLVLPAAVERFAAEMTHLGLPYPRADAGALIGLAAPGS